MQNMVSVEAIDTKTKDKVIVQFEENCVIEFNGKKFESGGAFISPRYIIAYLVPKIDHESANSKIIHYEVQTWHGDILAKNHVNVYNVAHTKYGKIEYVRFRYNGIVYSGKTCATGNLLKAYATKLRSVY